MYTTKPHFYQETSRILPKIGAGFPTKSLPALRIRKEKPAFAARNAADFAENLAKSNLIIYESEV